MKVKTIRRTWLIKQGACTEAVEAWGNEKDHGTIVTLKRLIKHNQLDWANWLIVRVMGRKQVVGRPLLYGTTREFLEYFGLASLGELPKMEELVEKLAERAAAVEEEPETGPGEDEDSEPEEAEAAGGELPGAETQDR